jgi:hypothetical protein
MPIAIVLLIRWHVKRSIPWLVLLMIFGLFFFLNPIKSEYRYRVWWSNENFSMQQRIMLWSELIKERFDDILNPVEQNSNSDDLNAALNRLDLLHKFTYVISLTPHVIPYYQGKTYSYFFVAFVPRFLWPNKPVASAVNNQLDVDYRLLRPAGTATTAMGIGQLAEGYANFGILGVLLTMSLQGLLFAMLDTTLNRKQSEGGRAIYLSIAVYFIIAMGTTAAVVYGALLQQIAVSIVLMYPFTKRVQPKEQRSQVGFMKEPVYIHKF